MAPADTLRDPETFPPRTPPDNENKPRFVVGGEIGPPRRSDEMRRHVYKFGTTAVRIKIIRTGDAGALNWYRVLDGEVSGWRTHRERPAMPLRLADRCRTMHNSQRSRTHGALEQSCGRLSCQSLLAEIEYRAKSAEGKLRHAFFKGTREDL
jgi:hypothetical protein